ncbi:IS256 family transposase [Collinsella sp. CLA-AA-H167]|uniref:transposase-like zinc-binding domain-containing protein n=1 Tax=Collinsella sp. CLA-AA-H167 TaxID=3136223 RepID=UPI0032C10252
MKAVYCPYCGGRTKRNGRTSSGSQRWRCTACGASTTVRYDDTATRLDEFLGWLLSKDSQAAMPGGGRSFRRRTAEFWEVWPMPVPDGGSGFAKAVRETWPRTRVQRCTFHAFSQVKRYTTTRPKLQAGRELYLVARDLMGIETLHQAELWVERYLDWCGFWADFLEDRTVVDGRRVYTHERLRRARSSLSSLVSAGTLFTYLDPALAKAGPLPSTNNMIEGGVNSQLRAVLRNHRGLTSVKRVKAVFWWCHAHSGDARTAREKLATMPTDADIDFLFSVYSASPSREDGGPEWGDRAVWEDLHHRDPYPFWLD